eukprot:s731_g1.t1
MAMKIVAAAAGAMAFQVLGGLFASPARAAWGWFLDVPAGLGFSCSEGTSLGCATPAGCEDSNFSCTVVPDAGMSCDVTSTNVRCSIAGGAQNFVPDSASPMCAQVNTSSHYNNASLSWSPVPTCGTTTTGQTSTSDASMEMVGFVAAALASATTQNVHQRVGSGFLVMKPGDQRYKVTTGDSSMVELELSETDGKSAKAAGEQRRDSQDPIVAKASAKGAKEYLEHHGIFSFVQAVLQAVIEDQPTDPYRFMARLFLDGGYRESWHSSGVQKSAKDFTATSEPKGPKQTNDSAEEAPAPPCDRPPSPPPAEGKTELQEESTAKADPPPA